MQKADNKQMSWIVKSWWRGRFALTPVICGALLVSAAVAALAQVAGSPTVGQAAQQLGISPSQASQLESQISHGGLSGAQLQQACAAVAAKHLSSSDVQSMGASLGLSADQVAQLQQCAQGSAAAGGSASAASTGAAAGAVQKPATLTGPSPQQQASLIENRFHQLETPYKLLAGPRTTSLVQFGYSLFSSPVSTFAPVANVPVSSDYTLGPGDGLNVLLWGRVNRTLNLEVQRDGTVLMPEIGPIGVAGLTFEQAKKLIESRAGQITGVQVDVTMGQIRTIEVFVVGKVNHPGLYLVSALSHVSNALVAAGGVSKVGSLRNIELRRGNRIAEVIDVYSLLLHGDTSADIHLEPRDVIFVPAIGPVVGVVGDVKNPAIYELKGRQSLATVLRMAGGVSAFGYGQRIQVERIQNHERRVALDIGLRQAGAWRFPIKDGDLIKVFTVLPRRQDIVRLSGNVNRPGSYQWYPGMRVADLIREGQGVGDRTFFDYALLRRVEGPERKVHFIPVKLGDALRDVPAADIVLERDDTLTIYSDNELEEVPTVTVSGAVRRPGTYPLTDGMTVSDLVYEAGGLKENAYRKQAEVARTELINGARAGFSYIAVNLGEALMRGPEDLPLSRGDVLVVQQASNWHQPWVVNVGGEVLRPGPYVIKEGERLASVMERAGALRSDAYLPATVFIRRSVQQIEQQRLNESRARLREEAARLTLMPPEPGQQATSASALAMIQQVLASTESQQAVGRIVLHLSTLTALAHSANNLVLENGDRIVVPRRPASVNVLGQVYNPTALVYQPGLTVRDYLEKAGGPTEGADEDHIFVIAANGSVLTDEGIRNSKKNALFPLLPVVSGGLMETTLGPGDTVYVPEKLLYISGLQYATSVTQIIANSVMAIAMFGILGSQL